MIELKIKDKPKLIKFNLKSFEREQSLRTYWYAISDIPKYQDKKIKIKADDGKTTIYKIGDIENCEFKEEKYVRDEPVMETKVLNTNIEKLLREWDYDFFKIPENIKQRAIDFLERLLEENIMPNLQDDFFLETISEVMVQKEIDLGYFIEKYKKHLFSKKG